MGLAERAATAWRLAEVRNRITLHECRHTFASLMIAAGVNAKALSTYMGHSSVTINYDRYGHLMPGNEDAAAALLDAYLERANTKARSGPGRGERCLSCAGQSWASRWPTCADSSGLALGHGHRRARQSIGSKSPASKTVLA